MSTSTVANGRIKVAIGFIIALTATLAAPLQAAKDVNLKSWITGPVRYIAEAEGFDVSWLAVDEENEVGIDLMGGRQQRVLID